MSSNIDANLPGVSQPGIAPGVEQVDGTTKFDTGVGAPKDSIATTTSTKPPTYKQNINSPSLPSPKPAVFPKEHDKRGVEEQKQYQAIVNNLPKNVKKAVENFSEGKVNPKIKKPITDLNTFIKGIAQTSVKQKQSVPSQEQISSLQFQATQNAIKQTESMINESNKMISFGQEAIKKSNMKNSDKIEYLDFLKVLAKMLSELKQVLYEIQQSDAEKNKSLASLNADTAQSMLQKTIENLKKRQEQIKKQKELEKKQKEQQKIGLFASIGAMVLGAALVATGVGAGIGVMLMVGAAVSLSITVADMTTGGKATQAINESLKKATDAIGDFFGLDDTGKALLALGISVFAIALIAAVTGGMAAVVLSSILLGVLFSSNLIQNAASDIVKLSIKTFNPDASEKDEKVATIVMTFVLMAIIGAASGKGASKVTREGVSMGSKAQVLVKGAQTIGTGLMAGAQIASGVYSVQIGMLERKLADLIEDQGELEEVIALLKALIKLIEQTMNKLSGNDDISKEINDISQMFMDTVSGLSQTTTNLHNAAA